MQFILINIPKVIIDQKIVNMTILEGMINIQLNFITLNSLNQFNMRILLRKGLNFSFHEARHNFQGYRKNNLQSEPLQPYKYFLNYTYTPLNIASINSDHLPSINYYEIIQIFKRLHMKERQGFLNYPFIQRFLKIRTLMLYLEARHRKQSFIVKAQMIYKYIYKEVIDYKYSELYEEGVLIKMVANYRDFIKTRNKQSISYEFADFLQYLLNSAWEFQKEMNVAANILGVSIPQFEQSTPKLRINSFNQKSLSLPLPLRTFIILNRPVQYNENYNSFNKSKKNMFNDQYHQKLAQQLRANSDAYKLIFERQLPLFKNTCLTRLDYLVAMDYIISISMGSEESRHRLMQFMKEWKEQWKQRCEIQGDSWLLQLLVCQRITQRLINYQKQTGQQYEQFLKQFNITCLEMYKKALANISTKQLCLLISHHSSIFKSYLIVNFSTQKQMVEVKSIYLNLFERIFDFYEGGILLFEQLGDIQFIFQAILAICSEQDSPLVHQIMKNYERILVLKPSFGKTKIINNYHSQYFICLKYDFKSDIIAENLWKQIDYFNCKGQLQQNRNKNEQEKGVEQKKQQKAAQQFTKLLLHFFYIYIIEKKSEKYEKAEKVFLTLLKDLDLKLLEEVIEKNHSNEGRKRDHSHRQGLLDHNQQKSQNRKKKIQLSISSLNRLYLIILILQKTSLLNLEGCQKIVRKKVTEIFNNTFLCQALKKCISYPGIYESICLTNDIMNPKIQPLISFIDDVDKDLNLKKQQNGSQALSSHHSFKTQDYSLFLDNFIIDPLNVNLDFGSDNFVAKNKVYKKQTKPIKQKNKPKKSQNEKISKVEQVANIKVKTQHGKKEEKTILQQNVSLPKVQKQQQVEKITLKQAESILQMLLKMPFPKFDSRAREIQSRKPRYFVNREAKISPEIFKNSLRRHTEVENSKSNQNSIISYHPRYRSRNVGLLKLKSKTFPLLVKKTSSQEASIQKGTIKQKTSFKSQSQNMKQTLPKPSHKFQQRAKEKSMRSEEPKPKLFKPKDQSKIQSIVSEPQPSKSLSISTIRQKLKLLQSKIIEKGDKLTEIGQNKETLDNQQPSNNNISDQIIKQTLLSSYKIEQSDLQENQLIAGGKTKSNKKKKATVKKVSLRPSKK